MSTIDQRTSYLNSPYFTGHIYGNFSPFYVTIAICSIFLGSIIILNVVLGCCSRHRKYWQDRHTGNRWLVSIWSATPHAQPPLDFTELKDASHFHNLYPAPRVFNEDIEAVDTVPLASDSQQASFSQHFLPHHLSRTEGRGHYDRRQREQYVELQKRESDI